MVDTEPFQNSVYPLKFFVRDAFVLHFSFFCLVNFMFNSCFHDCSFSSFYSNETFNSILLN